MSTLKLNGDAPAQRKPSQKQAKILRFIREMRKESSTITLDEAIKLVGSDIYYNEAKHVGAILSNMVKRGMITRVKPGVFKLP